MLSVCTGLTPDNRPGLVIYVVASPVNTLAVTLHVCLLEVCAEAVHIMVVWEYCMALGSKEIIIPYAKKRQYYRDIILNIRIKEMHIHYMCACKQLAEIIITDYACNG